MHNKQLISRLITGSKYAGVAKSHSHFSLPIDLLKSLDTNFWHFRYSQFTKSNHFSEGCWSGSGSGFLSYSNTSSYSHTYVCNGVDKCLVGEIVIDKECSMHTHSTYVILTL